MTAPAFLAIDLTKTYPGPAGPVSVFRAATFEVPHGVIAVVGPSGSGKSTVLNLFGGLDRPTAGKLVCRGRSVPFGDERAMRNYRLEEVCPVFQDLNLLAHLTAGQNAA